jgi:hypothetical protein
MWFKLITTPPQFYIMQDDNFVWKIIGSRQIEREIISTSATCRGTMQLNFRAENPGLKN